MLEIVGDGTYAGTTVKLTGEDGQALGGVTCIDLALSEDGCVADLEVVDVAVNLRFPITVVAVGKPEPLVQEEDLTVH